MPVVADMLKVHASVNEGGERKTAQRTGGGWGGAQGIHTRTLTNTQTYEYTTANTLHATAGDCVDNAWLVVLLCSPGTQVVACLGGLYTGLAANTDVKILFEFVVGKYILPWTRQGSNKFLCTSKGTSKAVRTEVFPGVSYPSLSSTRYSSSIIATKTVHGAWRAVALPPPYSTVFTVLRCASKQNQKLN